MAIASYRVPERAHRAGQRSLGVLRQRGQDGDDAGKEPERLHDPDDDEGVGADRMDEEADRGGHESDRQASVLGILEPPRRGEADPEHRPQQRQEHHQSDHAVSTSVRAYWASMNRKPVTPYPNSGRLVHAAKASRIESRRSDVDGSNAIWPRRTVAWPRSGWKV